MELLTVNEVMQKSKEEIIEYFVSKMKEQQEDLKKAVSVASDYEQLLEKSTVVLEEVQKENEKLRWIAKYGKLNATDLKVIAAIHNNPEMTAKEIGNLVSVDHETVKKVKGRLKELTGAADYLQAVEHFINTLKQFIPDLVV